MLVIIGHIYPWMPLDCSQLVYPKKIGGGLHTEMDESGMGWVMLGELTPAGHIGNSLCYCDPRVLAKAVGGMLLGMAGSSSSAFGLAVGRRVRRGQSNNGFLLCLNNIDEYPTDPHSRMKPLGSSTHLLIGCFYCWMFLISPNSMNTPSNTD